MKHHRIQVLHKSYVIVGLTGLLLVWLAQALSVNGLLTQILPPLGWQILSGVALLALVAFQWGLFYNRLRKHASGIRRYYALHKYLGLVTILIFALHAARTGHGWTLALFIVFVALATTGLLNRGIMRYHPAWWHSVWLWLHISLSALLIPLVVLHVVVALAYT